MTKKEAIAYIKAIKNGLHETGKDFPYRDEIIPVAKEALEIAIKALEQEPCDDAISRQKLLKAIATLDKFGCDADKKLVRYTDHYVPYIRYHDVIDCIELAFPFTPQPKIGKWIYRKEEDSYRCNLCTFPCHKDNLGAIPTEYCAGCGAKMSEISTGSESEE